MSAHCEDCQASLLECDTCAMAFCPACCWEGINEGENNCLPCMEVADAKRRAEFAYLEFSARQHVDACRSLDIPTTSTDSEVMAAARLLK